MFIGLGVSGVVPVLHGITIYGYQGMQDRMSLGWTVLQGAMYIFGAVLYAVSNFDIRYPHPDKQLMRDIDSFS